MSTHLILISIFSVTLAQAAKATTGPAGSSLVDALKKNWGSGSLASCDLREKTKALYLAQALDARADQLRSLPRQKLKTDSNYVQMGSMIFRDPPITGSIPNGWITDPFSWDSAYSKFQQIKNTPVDENWAALSRDVHALITQDKKRLLNNINMELNHKSGPLLLGAMNAIEGCLQTINCDQPNFGSDVQQFVQQNSLYKSSMNFLPRLRSAKARVTLLQMLRNRMKVDYDFFFGFNPSSAVRRVGAGDFEIAVDPGPLKGYENDLENVVKSVWTSNQYRLTVKWVTPADGADDQRAFKIVVDPSSGNPVTDTTTRTIRFYQGNQLRSVAHELGHALGFPDHTYGAWNPQSCEYAMEIHPGDIMSQLIVGQATPGEWATLDAYYPWASVPTSARNQSAPISLRQY